MENHHGGRLVGQMDRFRAEALLSDRFDGFNCVACVSTAQNAEEYGLEAQLVGLGKRAAGRR